MSVTEWSVKKIATVFAVCSLLGFIGLSIFSWNVGNSIVTMPHAILFLIHQTSVLWPAIAIAAIVLELALIYGLFKDNFYITVTKWVWTAIVALLIATIVLPVFWRYNAGHDINASKFYIDFAKSKGWEVKPPETTAPDSQ